MQVQNTLETEQKVLADTKEAHLNYYNNRTNHLTHDFELEILVDAQAEAISTVAEFALSLDDYSSLISTALSEKIIQDKAKGYLANDTVEKALEIMHYLLKIASSTEPLMILQNKIYREQQITN